MTCDQPPAQVCSSCTHAGECGGWLEPTGGEMMPETVVWQGEPPRVAHKPLDKQNFK